MRAESFELLLFKAKMVRETDGRAAELAMSEQALAHAPANPPLHIAAAQAAVFCDAARAVQYAEAAVRAAPRDRGAYGHGDALLAAGRAREAAQVADRLRKLDPDDGHAIALAASAWRMLGDPRYRALYDYGRFVKAQAIDTPDGWLDLPSYLDALTRSLRAMHGSRAHPLDQTLRGGSQVDLEPEHLTDPVLRAFPEAIDGPIHRYLGELGHAEDTFRRRNRDHYRFSGMWSVLLRPHGHHFNHFHGKGWISSACYIDIPPPLGAHGGEGWLKFGEPVMPTHPSLPAEYFIKPQPGLLVLFPSWMWHGTLPFSAPSEDITRLTVAFDLVPG